MSLIQELPNSHTSTAPGWAYVVDTGYDPSKAPIVPASGSRKRQSRNATAIQGNELTARQQNKINKHLEELNKESHRDVQIVVPNRPKDVAQRGLRGKMTPAVRKIMQSQKTFANHLADEEAATAVQGSAHHEQAIPSSHRQPVSKHSGQPRPAKSGPQSTSKRQSTGDAMAFDSTKEVEQTADHDQHMYSSVMDEDPFYKSRIPPLPSQQEIEALLSAPALPFAAAQAAPTSSSAPIRRFCEMCGYWGRVRCMKCGVRLCSLDCTKQHDETNCQMFYA